jgi:hypothetical protein
MDKKEEEKDKDKVPTIDKNNEELQAKRTVWERKSVSMRDISRKPNTIAQFMKEKTENPLKAMQKYGPDSLGEEQWIIGIIGIFQQSNLSPDVSNEAIKQLLKSLSHQHEEDSLFISFISDTFKKKAPEFNNENKKIIISMARSLKLLQHENIVVRNTIRNIIEQIRPSESAQISNNKDKKTMYIEIESQQKEPSKQKTSSTKSPSKVIISSKENSAQKPLSLSYVLSLILSSSVKEIGPSNLVYSVLQQNLLEQKIRLKIKKRENKAPTSIVTHPSAIVTSNLKKTYDIYFSKPETIHHIRSFFEQFVEILEEGYNTACVFLPDAKLWPDYYYAKHAALDFGHYIQIFNTKTYGIGISLLMEECMKDIREQKDIYLINSIIEKKSTSLRYWIIPNNFETCQNRFWFMTLMNNMKKKKEIDITSNAPVISLHNKKEITGVIKDITKSAAYLEKLIKNETHQLKTVPRRIIISYSNFSDSAIKLGKRLKATYPNSEISIVLSNKILASEFGDHISLGMLI